LTRRTSPAFSALPDEEGRDVVVPEAGADFEGHLPICLVVRKNSAILPTAGGVAPPVSQNDA